MEKRACNGFMSEIPAIGICSRRRNLKEDIKYKKDGRNLRLKIDCSHG